MTGSSNSNNKDLLTYMLDVSEQLLNIQGDMANVLLDYRASKRKSKIIIESYDKLGESIELFIKEKNKMEKYFADRNS